MELLYFCEKKDFGWIVKLEQKVDTNNGSLCCMGRDYTATLKEVQPLFGKLFKGNNISNQIIKSTTTMLQHQIN